MVDLTYSLDSSVPLAGAGASCADNLGRCQVFFFSQSCFFQLDCVGVVWTNATGHCPRGCVDVTHQLSFPVLTFSTKHLCTCGRLKLCDDIDLIIWLKNSIRFTLFHALSQVHQQSGLCHDLDSMKGDLAETENSLAVDQASLKCEEL